MNQDLVHYLQKQIRTTENRLRVYTHTPGGKKLPSRFLFVKIRAYFQAFSENRSKNRLVMIPGLRGVGKTTLMAQLCDDIFDADNRKRTLFLSLDDARALFDVGIVDIMRAYEEILGTDLETLQEKVFIFLDEVQSDPDWAKALKTLHDRTSNVFFCCTGSSAVVLQTTADLARGRAIFERMPPLCFSEYEMVAHSIYPLKDLKQRIREAIYFSDTAEEAYGRLEALKGPVNGYWSGVDRRDVEKFLTFGSLPFTLQLPSESAIYDAVSLLLDGIIKKDLPMLGGFDTKTLSQVKRLLLILAENDTTSVLKLEGSKDPNDPKGLLDLDRLTISSLLEALEKAELLVKVPAYGSNMTIAKKPAKYLFMSPAIRMSFFAVTGNEQTYATRKGKLLEDSIGSHLYREFILRGGGAFRYDSAQGGADFVLQIGNRKQLLIEAGLGKKDRKQILHSMERIPADYGIVFSTSPLLLDDEKRIIHVPLDYYFLM